MTLINQTVKVKRVFDEPRLTDIRDEGGRGRERNGNTDVRLARVQAKLLMTVV